MNCWHVLPIQIQSAENDSSCRCCWGILWAYFFFFCKARLVLRSTHDQPTANLYCWLILIVSTVGFFNLHQSIPFGSIHRFHMVDSSHCSPNICTVVPHKAVAEISKIGNDRRGWLLWVTKAEQRLWWIDRCFRFPHFLSLFLPLSLTIDLPTCLSMYQAIYLIYLILSYRIFPFLILSVLFLFYLICPFLIWSVLFLSYHILVFLIISFLSYLSFLYYRSYLSYLILSFLFL